MNPREESNVLLNDAIAMALELTREHGSHMPFCMAFTADGERVNIAADDSLVSGYDALFELVQSQVRQAAASGEYRAVAVARHVTLRDGTPAAAGSEAVQVTLDHVNDSACTCYLPYTVQSGELVPGELFAMEPVDTYFVEARPESSRPSPVKRPGLLSRLFGR